MGDSNVSLVVIGYAIYLPIAIFLTYVVAKTLFKNGKVFMLDIFKGREEIANSTNQLFQMGFYLLNIGFALLILKISYSYDMSAKMLIEILSAKLGGFSIYLGIMLFLNLYMFFRGKRKTSQHIRNEKYVENQPK